MKHARPADMIDAMIRDSDRRARTVEPIIVLKRRMSGGPINSQRVVLKPALHRHPCDIAARQHAARSNP